MYHEIHGAGGTPLLLLHEGRTGDIDRPLTSTDLASDVAGLLQHQDIAQADVLGFSVGGAVALHLAIRHPELVRKLVVSGWSDAGIHGIAAPTLITVGD